MIKILGLLTLEIYVVSNEQKNNLLITQYNY